MSRYYCMGVTVKEFNPDRIGQIKAAAKRIWNFDKDNWRESETEISGCGNSYLAGGESEEEFSECLAKVIFKANGEPCDIQIDASYLEDPPTESYFFAKDEYQELMQPTKPAERIDGDGSCT